MANNIPEPMGVHVPDDVKLTPRPATGPLSALANELVENHANTLMWVLWVGPIVFATVWYFIA